MRPTDFDHLTHLIYAGAVDDAAFQHALGILAGHYGCTSSAFVYADRLRPRADIQLTHGPFSSPELRARYMAVADEDPAPGAMSRLSIGEAAATDRLFSPEFRAGSRFLNEFYRPLGFEEALGGPVAKGDGRVGLVAVHRGRDREAFGEDEITSFARLLQHFAQALVLRRSFFRTSEQRQALADALDPLAAGIITFDRDGTILHANAKARAMLARNDGLSLTRVGTLHAANADAALTLRVATDLTAGRRPAPVLRVPRTRGQRPYLIRVDRRVTPSGSRGAFTLYISDPDTIPAGAEATLSAAFGLSRQGAELVATLVAGGDIAGYAAMTGITRNTAKYHLQAAFAATGTARQSDLVSRAAGVLRDLGMSGDGAPARVRRSGRADAAPPSAPARSCRQKLPALQAVADGTGPEERGSGHRSRDR